MIGTPALRMERSAGRAALTVVLRDGRPVPRDIAQGGSARVMLPRSGAGFAEAVFLNTSGGLASGDRLEFAMALGEGVAFTCSTQTAERAYLAREGAARVTVTARVGAGGRLAWLPQETILYEDCHLDRVTEVDLAPGATCLLVESVVLGRRAMGEDPARARLSDRRMVRMGGRPLWAEAQRLEAGVLADAGLPAVLGGCPAFAVLALCGAGAEAAAGALASLAAPGGVEAAAAGWNGRTVLRLVARDAWALKTHLGRAIALLTGAGVPRTWNLPPSVQGAAA